MAVYHFGLTFFVVKGDKEVESKNKVCALNDSMYFTLLTSKFSG